MRRKIRVLAVFLALAVLTGCAPFNYENLYSLPRATEDYYDLQNALSEVLERGWSYLSPTSGARQEPVQLTDLDGDGVDEAVAFFRDQEGAVKVYIYAKEQEVYTPAAVLDGAGSGVARVEYADLDGEGSLELILTYQVSQSVTQALQVYRYRDGAAVQELSAACSRYVLYDLDGDGLEELLSLVGTDNQAQAECYDAVDGELRRVGETRLRFSYDELRKLQQGRITESDRAVVVSGVSGETLLTDVLVLGENGLGRVEPKKEILTASSMQSYYVYPEDSDSDGALEFPVPRQLPAYNSGSSAQWVIDWYRLQTDGKTTLLRTEFRSKDDGWALTLPPTWENRLTIKAGETTEAATVTFYHTEDGEDPEEILTVYTLKGMNRTAFVEENGLSILVSDGDTTVAVKLREDDPWEGSVSLARVSELFRYEKNS